MDNEITIDGVVYVRKDSEAAVPVFSKAGEVNTNPPTQFPLWKTIKLGTHKDVDSLLKDIRESGCIISSHAAHIAPHVTLSPQETTIDLYTATVSELGFNGNARVSQVWARLAELGYELCPSEVGLQLRLQYLLQNKNEFLTIAMEPIAGADACLRCFRIYLGGDGLWLDTSYGIPEFFLYPGDRVVFSRCNN